MRLHLRSAAREAVAVVAALGATAAVLGTGQLSAGAAARAQLPSHALTPGDYAKAANTTLICAPRWPHAGPALSTRVQRAVFARYHLGWATRTRYTLDLLVPRELGGTATLTNLWPQPRSVAAGLGGQVLAKNRLEDAMRARVCEHTLSLATARHALGVNWVAAYGRYVHSHPVTPMPPTAPPPVTPSPVPPPPVPPRSTVTVHDTAGLLAALRDAGPGTDIELDEGRYARAGSPITVDTACTASAPCILHGDRGAVLDGTGMTATAHYGLHLQNAAYWTISGFRVTDGNKGVVLDASSHDTLTDLEVDHVGDEGVHLRDNSSGDVLQDSYVHDTGLEQPEFGEGIYVGSAKSNWAKWSQGKPDGSNGDTITGNVIAATTAENVDIKEGTSGGVLSDNSLDASAISGKNSADSWVDVKGNNWLITGNHGTNTNDNSHFHDGFQTHVQVPGDGQDNRFTANRSDLGNATGYAINIERPRSTGNVVGCDNTVAGAQARLANEPCTSG